MKTSILIFIAGLILGIAGTLVTRQTSPSSQNSAEEKENGSPARTRATDRTDSGTVRHRRAVRMRQKRSANGGSSSARDDLTVFLTSLSDIDDEEELNVMELIRGASLLTRLREDEALDLLQFLAEPQEDDSKGMIVDFREVASVVIFCRLCELNGPAAMQLASTQLEDENNDTFEEECLTMGMNSWVAADPDGARQWFEGLVGEVDELASNTGDVDDVELKGMAALLEEDEFRAAYFNGMAKHDPEGLEKRIAEYENEEIREAMHDDLMNSLVRNEESVEGLRALLDKTSESSEARYDAVAKLSGKDPDSAAKWVESQPSSSGRDREVNTVGPTLMSEDEDAGIQWYMKQEMHDSNGKSGRLSNIVEQLAGDDLEKADEWLAQQVDGLNRDSAEKAIARRFSNAKQWSESMTWIADIQNEDMRDQSLKQMFRQGWDRKTKALSPKIMQAADAAGFDDEANAYRPD
jgi:hypothetical protein